MALADKRFTQPIILKLAPDALQIFFMLLMQFLCQPIYFSSHQIKINMISILYRHNHCSVRKVFCVLTVNRSKSQDFALKRKDSADRPPNLVLYGVEEEKIKQRNVRQSPTISSDCPIVRHAKDYPRHRKPAHLWLDSFKDADFTPTQAIELHPEIFVDNPRPDFLYLCKKWQKDYREVDYEWKPTRADIGRGKKKPWPQKGSGRARHGSTNAPQWKGGGVAHGPRGPRALYTELLPNVRLRALTSALTVKHHQEDLLVLEDFDVPSSDKDYLLRCFATRKMEERSALLLFNEGDNIREPDNISQAVDKWPEVNLMPLVGLNVWSILHHDKLVMTLKALEELETKLAWHMHRYQWIDKPHNFYKDLPFTVQNAVQ